MRASLSSRLAWGLFAACVPLYGLNLVLTAWYRSPLGDAPLVTSFLVTPGVGALIASRHPQNAVGWLLIVTGLGFGVAGFVTEYAGLSEKKPVPLGPELGAFGNAAFVVILVSGAILVPLLFPNGRLLSARWRWVIYMAGAALLVGTIGSIIRPGRLDLPHVESDNPLGVQGADWVLGLGFVLLTVAGLAAAISVVLRFRRSRGDERQQLKWFVFAVALMALAFAGQSVYVIELAFYILLFFGLPASIGIAILRYRLYDIDRIINRTLVYAVLTGGLGATYFGLVVGLQALLRPVSGGSDLAIVVTTLVVAALFLPARRTVQRAVDRRFNRRAYDATRTIDAFGARLREQVDLDTLHYDLLAIVDETMQPSRVSLWLRDPVDARR